MSRIITISREFGSGGREFGRRLSEELGIAYYDQEIIAEIVQRTSFSEEYIRNIMERRPIASYPIHIGRSFYPVANPMFEQSLSIYQEQSRIIRELAEKSDCIIVGRCADYILRKQKPFRIFIYADMESKMCRCREKAPSDEKLTDRELKQKIIGVDKKRAQYYEFYTGNAWANKLNYDLCLNTTRTEIKEIVPVLAKLFQ